MSKIDELLKNEKVEWKKLGEVCEIKTGQAISKTKIEKNKGIYPVINSGKDPLGYINIWNTEDDPIGITSRGAGVGSITYQLGKYYRGNLNYSVTIKDKEILRVRFLYHLLNNLQTDIHKLCSFNGIPALNASELKTLKIPIPSLETQEKIVKILDKFTNYVTKLQAELQARNKQYEHYRDIILSEEYLRKIYYKIFESENSHYKIKTMKLGEICEINTGSKPKIVIKDEGQYKYINGGTIESGYLDSYNCDEDTVTTPSRGQGGIGFIGYQHDKFWLGALCYSIKSINKDRISNKFIYYYLSHSNHILKLKKEGGTPAINLSDLKNIRISFPILEVQNKVVEVLDKFQDLLSDTQGLLPEEIEQRQKQYEYYREKLLTFEDKSDSTPQNNS